MTAKRKAKPQFTHGDLDRQRHLKTIRARAKPARPLTLPESANQMVSHLEEAISSGAVRLPIPGFLEALVDLKRALKA